jgi:nanoRNase/pAp phosphatase (c-di-AMP/oligoRNAs hydrolase)
VSDCPFNDALFGGGSLFLPKNSRREFFYLMALTVEQQVNEQVRKSQSALIVLPQRPSTDGLAAALALREALLAMGKKADIVSAAFTIPTKLSFLETLKDIRSEIPPLQKCVITVDKRRFPVADISYTVTDETLRIFVTPKSGRLPQEAIEVNPNGYSYDLIVTINVVELTAIGEVYAQHKDAFFALPIINIDHRPENEQFGHINWVDIKATSTAEMIYHRFYKDREPDKDLATALLAGMMDETHSFRTHQVNPSTLLTVSKLLQAGAEYQTVTNHLYRTKTVGGLKLWGHVLTHLRSDRELSLAWSLIPASLFASTGTDITQLQELMTEILSHSPEARTVVLFIEHAPGQIEVQVTAKAPLHAKDLIKDWQPSGSERFASANIRAQSINDAEDLVINVVKKRLRSVMA